MTSYIALIAVILVFAVTFGFYVSWRATRLDRLHAGVETARAALDAALMRRCAAALELATSGFLDPASSVVLADAEENARLAAGPEEQELAESSLSHALRAVRSTAGNDQDFLPKRPFETVSREEAFRDVETAAKRVSIARHFYNDSVTKTLDARRKFLVRVFRLTGSAGAPSFFEMDESVS